MTNPSDIDGVLLQWGDRLFYPGNRLVRVRKGGSGSAIRSRSQRAAEVRGRIEATIVRRAPQVMVKVTGGGRGMRAITAHFRYISKNGRLEIEDERNNVERGRTAVRELAEDWQVGGSFIGESSERREAFNIMLSMPRGTDALVVQRAAREFAQVELSDHKYVMVLHDHQANPHVHISVRAESLHGRRLNPRKADLQRWRETFAEKLRGWGIDAEATRQASRGVTLNYDPLWRVKAGKDGRLVRTRRAKKSGPGAVTTRLQAAEAWRQIAGVLATSTDHKDRSLADLIVRFTRDAAIGPAHCETPVRRERDVPQPHVRQGPGPDRENQK